MFQADVEVMLKDTVADPQGITVLTSGTALGIKGLEDVRMGKLIQVKIEANNSEEAKNKIDEFSKKLLTNPVIEHYRIGQVVQL